MMHATAVRVHNVYLTVIDFFFYRIYLLYLNSITSLL